MKGYKSLESTEDSTKTQGKRLKQTLRTFRKSSNKKTFKECVSPTFLKMSNMDDLTWESYIACENKISRTTGSHLGPNYMYSTMLLHSLDLNSDHLSDIPGQQVWKGAAPLLRNNLHTAVWDSTEMEDVSLIKGSKPQVSRATKFGYFDHGMSEHTKEYLSFAVEASELTCSLSKMVKGVQPALSKLSGGSRSYVPLDSESLEKEQEIVSCIEGRFDRRALDQYFYTTDRVVIYPESADLLTNIFEADYHLDGFELDASLKDFILMMPEGFEINGVDVPSVQVSIGSRYQRDISMYAFVMDVLRNRCRDLGAALLYQEVIDEYERCALNFEGVNEITKDISIFDVSKWNPEQLKELEVKIKEAGYSLDDAIDALNLTENYYTQIVIRGGGEFASLGMDAFLNAVNADKDPESEKEFLENNNSSNAHQNQESADRLADVCKLICSVLVYCQALGDEVLHKGVPFKKDNVVKLSKNANKKKGTTSMTLRGPKGFSSKRAQSHYRKWHFRTLKDERFYQSDEWKDKPRGSRVVFVRDSVVNRDVNPHVLTDGTNVEDKVLTSESIQSAAN